MRTLIADADVVEVPDQDGWSADCDTWADVEQARSERIEMNELEAWIAELGEVLGVDPSAVDVNLLLDVARDAAHNVARPAAPLTTFMVGLAAGAKGGDAVAIRRAAELAQQLAVARGSDEPEA